MDISVKRLVRVQLINWHYFENERICLNGSTLISGENTAGKSTILDAIQMVLTTNTRKFNVAANEKGSRSLKSYVRCKVGNLGETYLRRGTVPANIALEFYEEKTSRYFVLGVHLLSPDEESAVIKKWYVEECRLEDLSFITDGRPSLAEEFRNKTRKLKYLETDKSARDRFRHRMGNLDEKFFDIVPKSLAFKPMDNVKEFINKFVLSEGRVDVQGLRSNIEVLDDLENTLDKTKKQLAALDVILAKFDELAAKERDIRINDILLKLASRDATKNAIETNRSEISIKKQTADGAAERLRTLTADIRDINEKIISIRVDISNNESSKLVENLTRRIDELKERISSAEDSKKKLTEAVGQLRLYIKAVNQLDVSIDGQEKMGLLLEAVSESEKNEIVRNLETHLINEYPQIARRNSRLDIELEEADKRIDELRSRMRSLEKRQLEYPANTVRLKKLIENEFSSRGIDSAVYILSDLLEITDETWRNAVEGYLNTQKFYLIVEPDYYNIALECYDRHRANIHSAGIINTRKLPLQYEENNRSLAYVVKSENRYAKAYVEYILGRVIRCEKAADLEEHRIAITPECMLYQGFVVRHLNPKDYKDPYIGINAYRVQLENVRLSIEEEVKKRITLRAECEKYDAVTRQRAGVNLDLIRLYMNSPSVIMDSEAELADVKAELKTAQKDPTLLQLQMKLNEAEKELASKQDDEKRETEERTRLLLQIEAHETELAEQTQQLKEKEILLTQASDEDGADYLSAKEKYENNLRRNKDPQKIYTNFSPQRAQFENEKQELLTGVHGLYSLQADFNTEFSLDFMTGISEKYRYIEAAEKLRKVEIVKYEEKLLTAREDCEKIFRSDFLSKMKEHIENAKLEFRNLNKALENVYYGDDSYHFNITFDKRKENLYRMITSEYNMEGDNNLWTAAFEAEYRDEIDDLFAKLMASDDNGEKVIDEYTDYRSYLDYDIEIRKRNGQRQRFSDIYGEKSGSETQVPYYVAIAASFYQLYRYGNSVRLMLLDEAFDKMDDDRIQSMMEFMNSLGLQVILATPPSKIEVIGERVNTILTAIRVGDGSIVEEYEL